MNERIQITRTKTGAMVFLPDGYAGAQWVFDDSAKVPTTMSLTEAYTNPDARGRGVATRLAGSLIRYATTHHPTITTVEAYVTSPASLRGMSRAFSGQVRIYQEDSPHPLTDENLITYDQALGAMALWEPIPEDERQRTHGLDIVASLEGLDLSRFEYPQ